MNDAEPSLLSTVRASWTEKDLIPEMADMHQRTIKRWWKKLGIAPDKGRRPNCWSHAAAERLVRAWSNWWKSAGIDPQVTGKKFSGAAVTADKRQLTLNFNGKEKFFPTFQKQTVTIYKIRRPSATNAASEAGHKKGVRTLRRVKGRAPA